MAFGDPCPRPAIGSSVLQADELRSKDGKLDVAFSFRSAIDLYKLELFCYVDAAGAQSPTLRVHPGDELVIHLKNELTPVAASANAHIHGGAHDCGSGGPMAADVTNLHFHGLALPPVCHQDETMHTLIRTTDPPFEYRVKIPRNESPGLYWYHPHPHGFSETQVLGGASGALIIEGIEKVNPRVAGLPERVLVLRDQRVPGLGEADEDAGPGKDVSLNYVPVMYPLYQPGPLIVKPGAREFWRVLNAAADTYFDLQVRFGARIQEVKTSQTLELIAMDGVVLGAESKVDHILLPPGARAEFIVTTPAMGMAGQLVSLKYDAGPDGANVPERALANIVSSNQARSVGVIPAEGATKPFIGLENLKSAHDRKLYFSEKMKDKTNVDYFITFEGETPKVFDMQETKPNVVVKQGTVEDWTIENRAREAHVFHIHQLHFQMLKRDGKPANEPMLHDTVDIPYWDGDPSHPYPSVTLRMDFRNPEIIGTFVYHCHILEHEDGGMMGTIRVVAGKPHANP